MGRKEPTLCRLLPAVVLAAAVSGCAFLLGGAAGAAAFAYVKGEGRKAYAEPLPKTFVVVQAALKDVGLPLLHKDITRTSAKIKSVTSDGKDVVVILTREGEKVTMVSVRVGIFGDRGLTELIFDKIEARLELM